MSINKPIAKPQVQLLRLIAPKDFLCTKKERLVALAQFAFVSLPIYQAHKANFERLPPSFVHLINNLYENHTVEPLMISETFAQLKKSKSLGKHPFLAALTAPTNELSDLEKYKKWLGLLLLCCLQLTMLQKHDSAIQEALRQIRLIATKEHHAGLMAILPDIALFDSLELLLDNLDEIRAQLKSKINENHQYYSNFCCIHVAVRDAIQLTAGIVRNRKKSAIRKHKLQFCNDEKFDNQLTELKPSVEPETKQEEDESLLIQKARTFKVNDFTHHSIKFHAAKTKNLLAHFQRKALSLSADPNTLTEYDVKQLVVHCLDNIDDNISCWLLLSLLLGRSYTYIFDKNQSEVNLCIEEGSPYYHFEYQVPASKQSRSIKKILRETTSVIYLSLPILFAKWISNRPGSVNDDEMRAVLQKINRQHRTKLTTKRIVGFLNHYLTNQGVDNAVISLLRNESYISNPSAAYLNVDLYLPQSCHSEYIQYIFDLVAQKIAISPSISTGENAGSALFVDDKICHNLFDFFAHKLSKRLDWSHFHNQFLLYVWSLLVFCSGHRDVNAPFGRISNYNAHFGTWWISDKECHSSLSARTLFLPETAQRQISFYLEHLKALIQETKFIAPKIKQRCADALNGNGNLLFAVIKKKHGYEVSDITPSLLGKLFPSELPLPNNWTRHYWRSLLTKQGINSDLINAWMGHQDKGVDAFSKHSGLSIKDLKIISDLIETKLKELNVEAVQGWDVKRH